MEFNHLLSDGRTVKLIRPGTFMHFDVYSSDGSLLGAIWVDGDDGTEDEALKPFEAELINAIRRRIRLDFDNE